MLERLLAGLAVRAVREGGRRWGKPLLVLAATAVVMALVAVQVLFGSTTSSTTTSVVREAVRAQQVAGTTSCTPGGGIGVALGGEQTSQYDQAYIDAAAAYPGSLSAPMLKAQAWTESGFRADAGSPAGAYGWMQFMPGTWRSHGIDGDGDGRADIGNPVDSIFSAAKYGATLRGGVAPFVTATVSSDTLVLAAYNAGSGNVAKYRGVPPFAETQSYVRKIPAKAAEFAAGGAAALDGSSGTSASACGAVGSVEAVGGYAAPMTQGSYRLSSGFGPRRSPGGIGSTNHAGTDLAAPIGTPIYAVAAGTVLKAGAASGYGQAVYLQHADGTISRYGHVSAVYVQMNETVAAGQRIAAVGNEGRSTGPHLHLECRPRNVPVDCIPWLAARGIRL